MNDFNQNTELTAEEAKALKNAGIEVYFDENEANEEESLLREFGYTK